MKIVQSIVIALFLMTTSVQLVRAGGNEKAVIETSAVCDMCKQRIESAVLQLDGVKKAILNVKTKELTVKYNAEVIQVEEIRASVAGAGYDADDVKANKNAFDNLPACCKKSCTASKSSCEHK